uniref:Uncharacterized protein n=1 Tax=Oryza brachyantha TaxID=4533 RepID=J3M5A1_ORYBR
MYRRIGVSKERLHYVDMSQKYPFVLSSFALDEDCSCSMLEHLVALGQLLVNAHPWKEKIISISAIDPKNASPICDIIGYHVVTIDMYKGECFELIGVYNSPYR